MRPTLKDIACTSPLLLLSSSILQPTTPPARQSYGALSGEYPRRLELIWRIGTLLEHQSYKLAVGSMLCVKHTKLVCKQNDSPFPTPLLICYIQNPPSQLLDCSLCDQPVNQKDTHTTLVNGAKEILCCFEDTINASGGNVHVFHEWCLQGYLYEGMLTKTQ